MTLRLGQCFILSAGPGDAAALGRVHVQAWREAYAGLLAPQDLAAMRASVHAGRFWRQLKRAAAGEVTLVAEGPEGIVGYVSGALAPGAAEAEVSTLYLLGQAQGLNLGRRLLAGAARALAAQGAQSLRLWLLEGNVRAAGFYHHLGGAVGETRPVRGWGAGQFETLYRWPDIESLWRAPT